MRSTSRKSSGTCDTEASYMAWIAPIPPSARHPYQRYQVRYQDGKRQRSAGIFPTRSLALAEKRAIERGDREQLIAPADLGPRIGLDGHVVQ
jgi:hypothetical protein